jgi:DNA gyrase/topoisomerase IV subunit A
LRQQADALKEEIATLADRQEGDSSADKPKRRNAEEANDATMDTSPDHERSISSGSKAPPASVRLSKEDEKALRDENEELNAKVAELHDEVAALSEESYNLKKERKAMKKQWEADRQQLENTLKQQWERERLALLAEKEELMDRCKSVALRHLRKITE